MSRVTVRSTDTTDPAAADAASDARLSALLTEVMQLGADLDVSQVLDRVTAAAARLTGAEYAALGVLAPDGSLSRFHTYGMPEDDERAIGERPRGLGVLGVLVVVATQAVWWRSQRPDRTVEQRD